jgi:hypothetical protein
MEIGIRHRSETREMPYILTFLLTHQYRGLNTLAFKATMQTTMYALFGDPLSFTPSNCVIQRGAPNAELLSFNTSEEQRRRMTRPSFRLPGKARKHLDKPATQI